MRYYIIWLRNNTDSRDDEPIKVKASSVEEAKNIAAPQLRNRFSFGGVYTLAEFKRRDPWWHSHFWGRKAVNE